MSITTLVKWELLPMIPCYNDMAEIQCFIDGMSCTACVRHVEDLILKDSRVESVKVNLASKEAFISSKEGINNAEIAALLSASPYRLSTGDSTQRLGWIIYVKLIFAIFSVTFLLVAKSFGYHLSPIIQLGVASTSIILLSNKHFISAFLQLKQFKSSMDTLLSLSIGVAFVVSIVKQFWGHSHMLYYDAVVMIGSFVFIGKWIEDLVLTKGAQLSDLLESISDQKLYKVINGENVLVGIKEVEVFDRVHYHTGQIIAHDSTVVKGELAVDESFMTGEAILVPKTKKSVVLAGSIIKEGSATVRVDKSIEESQYGSIVGHVKQAQASNLSIQKKVDKVASVFVPFILLVAIMTFVIWGQFTNEGWEYAFNHAIMVLIIACPCALGLATPLVNSISIVQLSKWGALVQKADFFETVNQCDTIIFDKTGTLSSDSLSVHTDFYSPEIKEMDKAVLKAMTALSLHPISKSLYQYFELLELEKISLEEYEVLVGKGLRASFDKKAYFLLSTKSLSEEQKTSHAYKHFEEGRFDNGQLSVSFFCDNDKILAYFVLKAKVKEGVKNMITQLQNKGYNISILSGDRSASVASVAQELGVKSYYAEQKPEDKWNYIKRIQLEGHTALMIGDGINDAQAMEEAKASIAMSTGSDLAKSVADIQLMYNDVQQLDRILKQAKLSKVLIGQNIFWAFIYNLICIPLAAGVFSFIGINMTPLYASMAMSFSSISVVLNSLRARASN